ncbi:MULTISPECIES: hypothetical protein [Bacillus]|uniref:hypothetical protein n=1 Tax=Bacillus TaxID=1386 RepID=UPI000C787D79|nr:MULTISPECIES: hypothetical protein [Bacillus]PLR86643.1 hypothetical protein CVD23_05755 [Bacillus sp. V33-4]RSK51547.1 hypothetical protein EJA13_14215 [Bacillus canaveralius]
MSACPICNGFRRLEVACPSCGQPLAEQGRIMDYYDDYSPYMPIDQMKLEDGYPTTYSNQQCPHLFTCSECGLEKVLLVKE